MKFGGTSVGSAEAFEQVARIVKDTQKTWPRIVVITSAMAGVTDNLLECAAQAVAGQPAYSLEAANNLRDQHFSAIDELLTDQARRAQIKGDIGYLITDLINLCQAVSVLGEATPRAMAA